MKQSTIPQSLCFQVFINMTTNPKLKEMKNNNWENNKLPIAFYVWGRKEVLQFSNGWWNQSLWISSDVVERENQFS